MTSQNFFFFSILSSFFFPWGQQNCCAIHPCGLLCNAPLSPELQIWVSCPACLLWTLAGTVSLVHAPPSKNEHSAWSLAQPCFKLQPPPLAWLGLTCGGLQCNPNLCLDGRLIGLPAPAQVRMLPWIFDSPSLLSLNDPYHICLLDILPLALSAFLTKLVGHRILAHKTHIRLQSHMCLVGSKCHWSQ